MDKIRKKLKPNRKKRFPFPPNPKNQNITYLRFCFYGTAKINNNKRKLDDGIIQTVWMDKEEIKSQERMRSPMVLHCINDYLKGNSYPLSLINYF